MPVLPLTPKQFYEKMKAAVVEHKGDNEATAWDMEMIMVNMLGDMGFDRGIKLWRNYVRWKEILGEYYD